MRLCLSLQCVFVQCLGCVAVCVRTRVCVSVFQGISKREATFFRTTPKDHPFGQRGCQGQGLVPGSDQIKYQKKIEGNLFLTFLVYGRWSKDIGVDFPLTKHVSPKEPVDLVAIFLVNFSGCGF